MENDTSLFIHINVSLPRNAAYTLKELSLAEHRTPKEQAAYFIVEGLRSRGLLPEPDPVDLVLKTLGALDVDGSCDDERA